MKSQRILLDTQCWLWLLSEPTRLSPQRLKTLANSETQLYLSVASIWEIAIKHHLGKLHLPETPKNYIPSKMREMGVEELTIDGSHAFIAGELPNHHSDPFDRLIIGQSIAEKLPVLTSDKIFKLYGIEVIAV